MSKLLLTIAAAFLFTSTMAQAEVKTFNFTFSGANVSFYGEDKSNAATANGFITFDTDTFVANGNFLGFEEVIDLGLTVTGSNGGDGTFTKSDFDNIYLISPIALDFSRELIGQNSPEGQFIPSYDAYGGDFNFVSTNSNIPTGVDWFTLQASSMEWMQLTTMSVAAVPEADTSAMLLTGLGVVGLMVRRRNKVKAA